MVANSSCIPINFPGAQQIFKIERKVWRKNIFTQESVYGITSHQISDTSPKQLLRFNREHWSVENKSHWVRDTVFKEDLSKVRTGNAPATFAILRNAAISLVKLAKASCIASELRACSRNKDLALRAIGLAINSK